MTCTNMNCWKMKYGTWNMSYWLVGNDKWFVGKWHYDICRRMKHWEMTYGGTELLKIRNESLTNDLLEYGKMRNWKLKSWQMKNQQWETRKMKTQNENPKALTIQNLTIIAPGSDAWKVQPKNWIVGIWNVDMLKYEMMIYWNMKWWDVEIWNDDMLKYEMMTYWNMEWWELK